MFWVGLRNLVAGLGQRLVILTPLNDLIGTDQQRKLVAEWTRNEWLLPELK